MSLTFDTIKIGMHVKCIFFDDYYLRGDKTGIVTGLRFPYDVTVKWDDDCPNWKTWGGARYFEEINGKKRKPRKVIPDFPLDETLPVLMAGHLQDRARKRAKKEK